MVVTHCNQMINLPKAKELITQYSEWVYCVLTLGPLGE